MAEARLAEYVVRIASAHPRSAVILFGSRARGGYLPYSDFDLAVVLERVGDPLESIRSLRALKPRGLPLDLVVLEPRDLDDPLILKMLERCRILYDGLGVRKKIFKIKQRML